MKTSRRLLSIVVVTGIDKKIIAFLGRRPTNSGLRADSKGVHHAFARASQLSQKHIKKGLLSTTSNLETAKNEYETKHSAPGIPAWSPTAVLTWR
jgi:Tat protein secretion system quality control protein TatD with DNase activity